jgi:glycosyltransferase involved in cell wall biosynthesis
MKISLSIVHPCYNPKKGWEKVLVNNHTALLSSFTGEISVSLILVNDGSTTGISQSHIDFIRSNVPHFTYIHHQVNSGKGFALRSAIRTIHEGLIIYTDVDYPYKIENSVDIFRLLEEDECDVVIGVRTADYYKKLPLPRIFFSLVFRLANHLFFPHMFVKDTQSGLKGFNQKGKTVFLNTKVNGFLFDMEFIRLCSRESLRMRKIPLTLNDNIIFGQVKFSVIKNEILNFIRLLRNK